MHCRQQAVLTGTTPREEPVRHVLMTMAADGTDVNLFDGPWQDSLPDASTLDVYVDGARTGQSPWSLTFSAGQRVEIRAATDDAWFPVLWPGGFSADDAIDCVASVDDALPRMMRGPASEWTSTQYGSGTRRYMFGNCSRLASVPGSLLSNNPQLTDIGYAFSDCAGLRAVPEDLFAGCPSVTNAEYAFSFCTGLEALPEGLFRNNAAITCLQGTFNHCERLATVPEDLFAGCPAVTSFLYAFNSCSDLVAVPEDLFSRSVAATDFQCAFEWCAGLAAIPAGLFRNCAAARDFGFTFGWCSGLSEIPAGLFDGCPEATRFYGTFQGCDGLVSVPSDLFATQSRTGKIGEVPYCFSGCSSVVSALPEPWEWESVPSSHRYYAKDCAKASNYSSVPSGWK